MSASVAARTMFARFPRALARPAAARRFAAAAGASAYLHSLPALPYAYDVRLLSRRVQDRVADGIEYRHSNLISARKL